MEQLCTLGINPDVPKTQVVSTISGQPVDFLLTLRDMLFCKAAKRALITTGDELVGQRITRGGKPLNGKLADDV